MDDGHQALGKIDNDHQALGKIDNDHQALGKIDNGHLASYLCNWLNGTTGIILLGM